MLPASGTGAGGDQAAVGKETARQTGQREQRRRCAGLRARPVAWRILLPVCGPLPAPAAAAETRTGHLLRQSSARGSKALSGWWRLATGFAEDARSALCAAGPVSTGCACVAVTCAPAARSGAVGSETPATAPLRPLRPRGGTAGSRGSPRRGAPGRCRPGSPTGSPASADAVPGSTIERNRKCRLWFSPPPPSRPPQSSCDRLAFCPRPASLPPPSLLPATPAPAFPAFASLAAQ